jgi:hypothetical protein
VVHRCGMSTAILLMFLGVVCAGAVAGYAMHSRRTAADPGAARPACCAVGTVRAIADVVTIEVENVSGQTFVGRLHDRGDRVTSALRPGVILLVAFDPAAREELSLADDIVAVRAEFDQMMLRKGLVTDAQLDLIRHGTRSHGVVVAMRNTGATREDYREVELDLMVSRVAGGQFPAHETTLVPASALGKVAPGCVVETYYRPGDESAVAVSVPPR